MHLWKVFVAVAILVGLFILAAHCTPQETEEHDSGWVNRPEDIPPACDPDDVAPCPDSMFTCTEDSYGGKTCEEPRPQPDGGEWECYQQGTTLICRGDHLPDGGDWECVLDEATGAYFCYHHAWEPATDGGGEGHWECEYQGEFRICRWVDEGGSGGDADADSDADSDSDADIDDDGIGVCPPGVEVPTSEICDDIDNDCDGIVDEDCPGSDNPPCICIAGAERYCDTPDYCLWGNQICITDSAGELAWGDCNEVTTIPLECSSGDGWYSPSAEACCIDAGFCCQDMWDLNHNGDTWESVGNCVDIVCVEEEG